jgi:hypothetical protein
MASEHDLAVVTRIEAGTATGLLEVDDPADVVSRALGAVRVDVHVLPSAVALARVRLAEVVARARQAELDLATARDARVRPPRTDAQEGGDDGRDADRQAVRFALAILVPALIGGIAVHLADGLVLASALPAAALVALAAVVLGHRRPSTAEPTLVPEGPRCDPVDVGDAPVVRAAEAHLRRQRAAWKLSWSERDEPVPDLASWSPELTAAIPVTLVAVDPAREIDVDAHATMTATAPAAVHVVVLQPRG